MQDLFVIMHMFSERFYYGDQFTFDAADRRIVFNDPYGLCDRKAGLLKGEDSKVISKIVLYLIIPCVIINAFQVDYTSEKVQGLLLAFAASVMLQVVLLAIVWIAGRLMGLNEVEKASVYYSNAGNLIMPIVTFVLGQEWVLYGCVFMSVQIVFVWSHGNGS